MLRCPEFSVLTRTINLTTNWDILAFTATRSPGQYSGVAKFCPSLVKVILLKTPSFLLVVSFDVNKRFVHCSTEIGQYRANRIRHRKALHGFWPDFPCRTSQSRWEHSWKDKMQSWWTVRLSLCISWERSHIPYQGILEDEFPFPKVGYVTSPTKVLERWSCYHYHRFRLQAHIIDVDIKHWLPKR